MFILAIAVGVAALSSPVASIDPEAGPSVQVHYADLDLASDKGERRLRARIASAANLVCARLDGRDLEAKDAWRACMAEATQSAARQVEVALNSARTRLASASGPRIVTLTSGER